MVTDASVQDGIWAGGTDLTMQYVPYTLGDVDNDGFIDSTDVFELLLYVAKKSSGQKECDFHRRCVLYGGNRGSQCGRY